MERNYYRKLCKDTKETLKAIFERDGQYQPPPVTSSFTPMSLSVKVHYSFDMAQQVLYSRKVWWVESLAILVNRRRFTKLKPSKLVVTINSPLADLFIRQTFFTKCFKRVNLPNILPAKLSRYTVI